MTNSALIYFIVGVAVLIVVVAIVLVKKRMQKHRDTMAGLAQQLGGQLKRNMAGETVSGDYHGFPYTYRYFSGSKDAPPSLTITFQCAAPASLVITREKTLDRLAKNIGLSQEMQTNDPAFDNAFYLGTDAPAIFRDFLGRRAVREAVIAIFASDEHVKKLAFSTRHIRLHVVPLRDKRLESFPCEKVMEQMVQLARFLPDQASTAALADGMGEGERRRGWKRFRALFLAVILLIICVGAGLLASGLTLYHPLGFSFIWRSLIYSFVLCLLFLWMAFRVLKGSATAHRALLLLVILAVPGFFLAGIGAMVFSNGYLDRSTTEFLHVVVLEKHVSRNDKSVSYHLEVRHWRPQDVSKHFSVRRLLYETIEPGDHLTVRIRKGYWGQEWIEGLEKFQNR